MRARGLGRLPGQYLLLIYPRSQRAGCGALPLPHPGAPFVQRLLQQLPPAPTRLSLQLPCSGLQLGAAGGALPLLVCCLLLLLLLGLLRRIRLLCRLLLVSLPMPALLLLLLPRGMCLLPIGCLQV